MRKLIKQLGTTLMATLVATAVQASPLVIGGKNFTEQQLLTEMTAQYLDHQGFDVERRAGMGSAVLRKAQENGQVDLYWEYTGTSLVVYNKVTDKIDDPAEVYKTVKAMDGALGLVWLNPSKANNTYALVMRSADAAKQQIATLSDLAAAINSGRELTLATNAEWYSREDGYRELAKAYDFKIPRDNIKRMDSGLTYVALKEGEVDVALAFATDGRIPAFDFVVLEDDKNFFPNYAITPVVRKEVLNANPKLGDLMNALSAQLDNDTMSALNAKVDVDRQSIEEVAGAFLKSKGLL
ncbi:glycine betaine ABC transporter substrate-binding protein [Marinobacterium sp. D7]|uniref:glycine betaine ABC transporter substrate-binding protein n=1 Tax=Marinobacterium ramblicola TaxID=2849041 RepID=UPI001C2D6952|nr:glycine betaine ABC transporter substrate-binding protein [Marinobacterium ramblicola]MBV1789464.1 glycine betaine ABC transporter substrate-binding protein [Marinobacterium ramblicola]